jgi:hypothetical protein
VKTIRGEYSHAEQFGKTANGFELCEKYIETILGWLIADSPFSIAFAGICSTDKERESIDKKAISLLFTYRE